MPSKNMLPKGQRRKSVKAEYREQRTIAQEKEAERKAAIEANFGVDPDAAVDVEAAEELGAGEHFSTNDGAMFYTADFNDGEPTLEERIATNNWFTTKGATGSKVAQETHDPPRYSNPYVDPLAAKKQVAAVPVVEGLEADASGVRKLTVDTVAKGMRLDAYLAKAIPDISRARVGLLIDGGQVTLDGKNAKASLKLKGGETIEIVGDPQPKPLHATAEDIPLTVVYEDDDMAVIDKPAGMMVHAGAGSTEQNRGTLVNALLYRFGGNLSSGSQPEAEEDEGEADNEEADTEFAAFSEPVSQLPAGQSLRPGIVHRLDKQTSGLIVVAKNDSAHRRLSEMFASRSLRKSYLALVHGHIADDEGTVRLPIARDLVRRIRMTTRRTGPDARHAVSHWQVIQRFDTPYGPFTLVAVRIETGRTHQIRVHMQALGHPVVGDFLYGAPHLIKPVGTKGEPLELERNFLHAAELDLKHPRTGEALSLRSGLPHELTEFLEKLQG
jgi:23S rRNA pseudouridine1911/1915/1917 synthase